jgi:hypothetical protein
MYVLKWGGKGCSDRNMNVSFGVGLELGFEASKSSRTARLPGSTSHLTQERTLFGSFASEPSDRKKSRQENHGSHSATIETKASPDVYFIYVARIKLNIYKL